MIIISELASQPSGLYLNTLLFLTQWVSISFIQLLHHHAELVGLPTTGKDDKAAIIAIYITLCGRTMCALLNS